MSENDSVPGDRSRARDRDRKRSLPGGARNPSLSGSRDDTFDPDLERERLEPGMNTEGQGESGADPKRAKPLGNSNT
ncbi:hypothetical protein OLX23_14350 [Novosphingobium sp. JCM 18896]|nr:hypothetical protein [Novosphingobium sp. JCM 18896]